jgi:hypothetical protein
MNSVDEVCHYMLASHKTCADCTPLKRPRSQSPNEPPAPKRTTGTHSQTTGPELEYISIDDLRKRTQYTSPTNTPEQKILQRQFIVSFVQELPALHGGVLMVDDCARGTGDYFSRDLLYANIPAKQIHAPNIESDVVHDLKQLDVQTRISTLIDYIYGSRMLLADKVSVFFPDVFLSPIRGVLPACAMAFKYKIFRCTTEDPALLVFSTTSRGCDQTISVDITASRIPVHSGIATHIQRMGRENGYSVTQILDGWPPGLKVNYSTMLFCAFYVRKRCTLLEGECYDVDRIRD